VPNLASTSNFAISDSPHYPLWHTRVDSSSHHDRHHEICRSHQRLIGHAVDAPRRASRSPAVINSWLIRTRSAFHDRGTQPQATATAVEPQRRNMRAPQSRLRNCARNAAGSCAWRGTVVQGSLRCLAGPRWTSILCSVRPPVGTAQTASSAWPTRVPRKQSVCPEQGGTRLQRRICLVRAPMAASRADGD
jgi:hypothetical protein